jgi:uncharacterized protein YdeI (YjbR/CyaY-like superfamily)
MAETNPKVDAFIKNAKQWAQEYNSLRQLALASGLQEDFKWGLPCYTNDGNNIAIIQGFKNCCALMFFKGHLLKDAKGLLKAPGENSQTARRFEFSNLAEVTKSKAAIKTYLKEAIQAEELPTPSKKTAAKKQSVPVEFKEKLASNKKLKDAFEKLTPGRQRHYLMHFSSAKQAATRMARIDKCVPRILKGLGLTDR